MAYQTASPNLNSGPATQMGSASQTTDSASPSDGANEKGSPSQSNIVALAANLEAGIPSLAIAGMTL